MATVTIDAGELPPIEPGEEYVVRLRIVSNDQNRSSYWVYYKVDPSVV
jgi:hypothetical protein|tara:strand:- start:261 stop:404 length:144 start_codon:yes stop_codon:yes gene_type:complete